MCSGICVGLVFRLHRLGELAELAPSRLQRVPLSSTMPHFGQSIRYTISPLSRAPNVKFGGTLQVEQTKMIVPFRAFIPPK